MPIFLQKLNHFNLVPRVQVQLSVFPLSLRHPHYFWHTLDRESSRQIVGIKIKTGNDQTVVVREFLRDVVPFFL